MRGLILSGLCIVLLSGCSKERYVFALKAVKLNSYHLSPQVDQNLFVKVVRDDEDKTVLATTDTYPSTLTLPATFAITPSLRLHLYGGDHIVVELWGDVTGLIASRAINMNEYKIKFPLDMEAKNAVASFSVMGSW
jgi:hypothetical protein